MKPAVHPSRLSRAFCFGVASFVLFIAQTIPGSAQQAIILLRHAEQTPVGAMMDGDPPLNEAGVQRAETFRNLLKDAGINAIFVSQYARSRQTAEPLAQALNLDPQIMPKDDLAALTERLRSQHASDTVLVIGHSDTVPALLKAWGHKQPVEIARTEFNSMWFVVPRTGDEPRVSRLRL